MEDSILLKGSVTSYGPGEKSSETYLHLDNYINHASSQNHDCSNLLNASDSLIDDEACLGEDIYSLGSEIYSAGIENSSLQFSRILDNVQLGLDIGGFIPGVGAVPDIINAGIYILRGDWSSAALSALAAIPLYGDAVAAGGKAIKYGAKATKASKKKFLYLYSGGEEANIYAELLAKKDKLAGNDVLLLDWTKDGKELIRNKYKYDLKIKSELTSIGKRHFEQNYRHFNTKRPKGKANIKAWKKKKQKVRQHNTNVKNKWEYDKTEFMSQHWYNVGQPDWNKASEKLVRRALEDGYEIKIVVNTGHKISPTNPRKFAKGKGSHIMNLNKIGENVATLNKIEHPFFKGKAPIRVIKFNTDDYFGLDALQRYVLQKTGRLDQLKKIYKIYD